MKKQAREKIWLVSILAGFLLVILWHNFASAAKETSLLPEEEKANFTPLYPYSTDYFSMNENLAVKVGIDFNESAPRKIAVIDSGADVGIEALTGRVEVYRDYTKDNVLKLDKVSLSAGKVIFFADKRYHVGDLALKGAVYHMGYFDLSRYPALECEKKYAILSIVCQGRKQIFLDSDMDGDFSDEEALGIYEFDRSYAELLTDTGALNVVCTKIAANGAEVALSGDFIGHGTFIASLVGGECTAYRGLARDSRLMIYQIFAQADRTEQKYLAMALDDALIDGAEVINISLSLPADAEIIKELRQAIAEAKAKGVPIIAAAGNYGAAEDSLSALARENGVTAIGTLITAESYALGRGINLEEDFIPYYSSRAGVEYVNFAVAPGAAVAAVPAWMEEKYMFDEGSSIAAAVATACLAHALGQDNLGGKDNYTLRTQSLGYAWQREGRGLVQAELIEEAEQSLQMWREGDYICVENDTDMFYEAYFTAYQSWLEVPKMTKIAPHGVSYWLVKETEHNFGEMALVELYINEEQRLAAQLCWEGEQTVTDGAKQEFTLKAGQSADFYFDVTAKDATLEAALEILRYDDKLLPHGRVALWLYQPDGTLYVKKDYFGVSFAGEMQMVETIEVCNADLGKWRLVIAAAENLPLYNQSECVGTVEIR